MIVTITLNPLIDKTLFVDCLQKGVISRTSRKEMVAGGKGVNVARVLKNFGVPVKAFVMLGGHTGKLLADLIRRDSIPLIPFWVKASTRFSVRIHETARELNTTIIEEGDFITRDEVRRLKQKALAAIRRAKIVVLSGSVPGANLATFYRDLIREARKNKTLTILDTYGESFLHGVGASPFMVKPNRAEYESSTGKPLRRAADYLAAFQHFHDKGIEFVVISLGEKGLRASFKGETFVVKPPVVKEIMPVGSGDCLIAGIVYGLTRNFPVEECLRWGVAAGCANAAVWPIADLSRKQVERYIPLVSIRKV
ncbi:1-phosphofructokinase family hexose kinase [bacterium]|nr:1-phosphofructokinase family hexose kinase [bacterium]